MDKLKPCPFCGSRATKRYIKPFSFVQCKKCGASTRIIPDYFEEADGKGEAIEAWNMRIDDNEIVALEHPCTNCDRGWKTISEQGCTSCAESCERLEQYNRSQSRNV